MRRRPKYQDDVRVEQNRKQLVEAFEDLRKMGFIARANYLCCQSCAGYAIADKVSQMSKEKAAKVKGCVYWHGQDEDDILERGGLYLAYGRIDTTAHGEVGLSTEEVGKAVVELLGKYGLKAEWNGDGNDRIWVDLAISNAKIEVEAEPKKLPKRQKVLQVTGPGGWDGNVFAIMGNTRRALKDAGIPQEKISQVFGECTKGDYSHAVATCVSALTEAGYEVR